MQPQARTEAKPRNRFILGKAVKAVYAKGIKRVIDILLSMIALILLFPVFILIAVVITLDSKGPIFFTQSRLGKGGKVFKIIKFRTMIDGAEQQGTGIVVKDATDQRITKVGVFLRETSLDELPQLINIIKGDMSVVGPRPPAVYHPYNGYDAYPPSAKKRFLVRPGVTGLAQVTYRSNASWEERIRLDTHYVDHISFRMDVALIMKTVLRVLTRKDVY